MSLAGRPRLIFKSISNAILGMISEAVLVAAFILVGLAVCVLWWGTFR